MLMSVHLKKLQNLSNQASDHPDSYVFFAHIFTLFQAIVSVFKIALLQTWPNLNHTNKTPVNLYVADFKQPSPNNCTILKLHIRSSRKLHTISFQMVHNVVVCTVSQLNSTKIGCVVGSMEAPSKAFLLFFLLPDWLKLTHLKS